MPDSISAREWTDNEWLRVMKELSPYEDKKVAEQAVAKWRKGVMPK